MLVVAAVGGACATSPGPGASPGPVATIRVDGSAGVMPLVAALAREYRVHEPAIGIELGAGMGTRARVDALSRGVIDVAVASHGIARDELAAQGIVVHEVARVAVVFGVHTSVTLASLTPAQICDVYSGAVANWRLLGGPELPIAARARPRGEVDADVVLAGIGCFGRSLGTTAVVVEKPDEMAAVLAGTPGAIGMTSMPFVQQSGGRIRALSLAGIAPSAESVRRGEYPLVRASYLLTRGAPAPEVARFLAFVRGPAGARVIEANGGVPTR